MLRRTLVIVAFPAIVLSAIDVPLLRIPFDLAAFARPDEHYVHPVWNQYVQFLRDVRAHTRGGERIAILVPPRHWDAGYCYAYYRASYILAGREVLPLVDAHDGVHPENLRAADLVAVWRTPLPRTHRTLVWAGDGGALVRR